MDPIRPITPGERRMPIPPVLRSDRVLNERRPGRDSEQGRATDREPSGADADADADAEADAFDQDAGSDLESHAGARDHSGFDDEDADGPLPGRTQPSGERDDRPDDPGYLIDIIA
jgi:hypothetical protein